MNQPVVKIIYRDGKLDMTLTAYSEYRVNPELIQWDEEGYGILAANEGKLHRDHYNVIRTASYTLELTGFFMPQFVKLIIKFLMFWYMPAALVGAIKASHDAKQAAEALIKKSKGKIIY